MNAYTDVPGLEEVVLEESYVLAIRAELETVVVDVDFVLTTNHPAYVQPPATQRECFRRGLLRFSNVRALTWTDQGAPPATDATSERDYGHIDVMTERRGTFLLEGDWGRMEVRSEPPTVELEESEPL